MWRCFYGLYFLDYLRAEIMSCKEPVSQTPVVKPVSLPKEVYNLPSCFFLVMLFDSHAR